MPLDLLSKLSPLVSPAFERRDGRHPVNSWISQGRIQGEQGWDRLMRMAARECIVRFKIEDATHEIRAGLRAYMRRRHGRWKRFIRTSGRWRMPRQLSIWRSSSVNPRSGADC